MMVAVFAPRPPRLRLSFVEAAAAAGLLFVVLFWRLGATSFWDPDEAHYAQTTRELIATGDWWAPYYNEQPFFDKPILFHQLQAIAMLAFGANELGSRIVPALAALALVLFTGWLGARLVSRDVGVVAALLLAVNPGVFGLARYAILDTLFTAFLFAGAGLLAVAALQGRRGLQWPGYVLIGAAAMVKGPLAFVLPGLAVLVAAAASKDLRRRLFGLRWIAGLALAIGISAPWFLYMYLRFRDQFVAGYVLDENIRLFAADRFPGQPGPFFYLRIVAVGMLPWTGLLIGRAFDDLRSARSRMGDNVEVMLWAWTVAVIGFFSLSRFKLDHYVFAAAPTLCLLAARAWCDVAAARGAADDRGSRIGAAVIGPSLAIVGAVAAYFLLEQFDLPAAALLAPAIVIGSGLLATTRAGAPGGRFGRLPWAPVAGLAAIYTAIVLFVIPALDRRKVMPDLAAWVAARAGEGRVCSYQLNRWNTAFRFYVGRHVSMLDDVDQMSGFLSEGGPIYCAMPESGLRELQDRGFGMDEVYGRDGMWVTSGRALWKRDAPSDRFVIATTRGREQSSVEPGAEARQNR
jgi:4-amino-4-deoxy-L-arabinose transferase-like glycosyltransferase